MRLVEYPYVTVRISCVLCARRGRLRLARLAEKYGADTSLDQVIERVRWPCPYPMPDPERRSQPKLSPRCGIFLPDLLKRRPPDLAQPDLRTVEGGGTTPVDRKRQAP